MPSDCSIGFEEFEELMSSMGPFENRPSIAVAVSGGPDSIALSLLLRDWARQRGGNVIGLTVDHGLRVGAGDESKQVAKWFRALKIEHKILYWRGSKPSAGVQDAARNARYELMCRWCCIRSILHLFAAHHYDDQIETTLLRLERGSAVHGLAPIASKQALNGVRLLRPFLGIPRSRLRATLEARNQEWIEDPSNQNTVFARVRLRNALSVLGDEGFLAETIAKLSGDAGATRRADERFLAMEAVKGVELFAAGYAVLSKSWWVESSYGTRFFLLGCLLRTIGGLQYPVPRRNLGALMERIDRSGKIDSATLAGCRLTNFKEDILVCREVGRVPPSVDMVNGAESKWDRFKIRIDGMKPEISGKSSVWQVGALGNEFHGSFSPLPRPVLGSLPAFRLGKHVISVPHINYVDPTGLNVPKFSAIFSVTSPLVSTLTKIA